MKLNYRQLQIKNLLEKNKEVYLRSLRETFSEVSEMTIRRDLTLLEDLGFAIRTHGGAVSINKFRTPDEDEIEYMIRSDINISQKTLIAEKAFTFIEQGRSCFLDAGSTLMHLAKLLANIKDCTFITSAVNIAQKLTPTQNSVIMLGGTVNKNTLACSGPEALQMLGMMNIDLAVLGASGFSLEKGFSVSSMHDARIKTEIVKKARKTIMLMDTAKINRDKAYSFCNLQDINIWVMEHSPNQDIVDACKDKNVRIE